MNTYLTLQFNMFTRNDELICIASKKIGPLEAMVKTGFTQKQMDTISDQVRAMNLDTVVEILRGLQDSPDSWKD